MRSQITLISIVTIIFTGLIVATFLGISGNTIIAVILLFSLICIPLILFISLSKGDLHSHDKHTEDFNDYD